MPERMANLR